MQIIHSFSSFIAPNRSSVNLIFEIEFKIAAEELILLYLDRNLVANTQHTKRITRRYIRKNK